MHSFFILNHWSNICSLSQGKLYRYECHADYFPLPASLHPISPKINSIKSLVYVTLQLSLCSSPCIYPFWRIFFKKIFSGVRIYYIAYSTTFSFTQWAWAFISSWIRLVAPQALWLLVSMPLCARTIHAANNNHNYLAFPMLADRQIVGNCLPLQRML